MNQSSRRADKQDLKDSYSLQYRRRKERVGRREKDEEVERGEKEEEQFMEKGQWTQRGVPPGYTQLHSVSHVACKSRLNIFVYVCVCACA